MDNFEARYRAIVEKRQELRHPRIELEVDKLCVDGGAPIWPDIARSAVCWWLAGRLPDNIEFSLIGGSCCIETDSMTQLVVNYTDPADAILTAWEIILGIKEKP